MNVPSDLLLKVRGWVEKAENDLSNARNTLKMDADCPFDTVCFHAQQTAEKYIKAFLVFHGIDFPKTHDLVILAKLALNAALNDLLITDVQPLNRYSVEARYPGEWDPIDRAEAEQAVAFAVKARSAVRNCLPKEVLF
ncbi:MAG: HEPN domain-containing protein [Nitrospinae bacterium]|nr:HEPN domain-containing protein [Nitrospinota bacterium]MBF0635368.1 HEPN domain-containing protein [Nitrospinota bacterium]